MNILVFNPGSNSLKYELISADPPAPNIVGGRKLVSDVIEPVDNYGAAAREVLGRVHSKFDIVGHRVVHGGDRYSEPVQIDDEVIGAIEELQDLAPLHNTAALSIIRATRDIGIPSWAVFDTAFHQTLPDRARFYAIPWELTARYGIRRFGFHGISHNYLLLRYAELTKIHLDHVNIITLHLEGGSSATAIAEGKSIDTSMGFTPLEGLMMGTRSGDLDPALIPFLARKENVDATVIEEWLNKKSGLLGVSGYSQDTRELVQQPPEDQRTWLALEMFAYRVRKYIGAYMAAVPGLAAVVFSGGIGENTPEVRRNICEGLEWLGLELDPARNAAVVDREGFISTDDSRIRAWVIPTQEARMIAHQILRSLP